MQEFTEFHISDENGYNTPSVANIPDGFIKNVSNFAVIYCSTIEFKQKEITFLKRNHS